MNESGGAFVLMGLALRALFDAFALAVCVIIEHVAPIDRYTLRQRIPGALMALSGNFLGGILVWPVQMLWEWLDVAPFIVLPVKTWLEPLGGGPAYALQFALLVIVTDFLAYWRHRAEHSKWLWPVHAVHHAPTELHAANSIGHPLQALFSFAFLVIPLSLLEIPGPGLPLAVSMTVGFLALYIHSPIDIHFGKAARIVVDNRFHRIHHSLEQRHFDRNFGICFSCWDYLFGTAYTPESGEWPAVGVAEVPAPKTYREFLVLPFAQYRTMLALRTATTQQQANAGAAE